MASGIHLPIKHYRIGVWTERLILIDGREVILRPIEPIDWEPLRAAFSTLSSEEVRMRFMRPITEMTAEYAQRLCNLDPHQEFALVATEPAPAGEAMIGAVARLSLDQERKTAEFGLLVGRPVSGMGLGNYMMRKLMHWARRRGFVAIFGDVLTENSAMLRLSEHLGFSHRSLAGEPGVIRVWKDLVTPPNAMPDAGRSVPR